MDLAAKGDILKITIRDTASENIVPTDIPLDIVYEDDNILLINKPVGMLSQPADDKEPSLVEYLTGYLLESGAVTEASLHTFRPSVCNRLDRNTSGLVAAGKSLAGLQELSSLFHDRSLHKFYRCLVIGVIKNEKYIKGYCRLRIQYQASDELLLPFPVLLQISRKFHPKGKALRGHQWKASHFQWLCHRLR